VVAWDNINDLIFKVNKYLNDDNKRGKVGLNGCFKARTKHTWHHFAKDLKTLIDKYK
jgi:spore maturation protein CgeB